MNKTKEIKNNRKNFIKKFVFLVVIFSALLSFILSFKKSKEDIVDNKIEKSYEIISSFQKEENSFTQGLEIDGDFLYESSGLFGKSFLRKINLKTKKVQKKVNLENKYFAEGLSIIGDEVFLLTWKSRKVFVYNKNNLEKIRETELSKEIGEGWGLSNDGKNLFISNGSSIIWKLNKDTFKIISKIEIMENEKKLEKINELEFVDGKIIANVWFDNNLYIINSKNGKVLKKVNFDNLVKKVLTEQGLGRDDVMNGVAYVKKSKTFLITGKNWKKVFEIKIK